MAGSNVANLTNYFIAGAAEAFSYRIAPLASFTNAFLADGCKQNDIVRVPFVTASAASSPSFAHATGYVSPDSYVNGVAITMASWKYQEWDGTDSDLAHLNPDSITALGRKLGNKLAYDVITDILSTTSSFTNKNQSSGSAWSTVTPMIALGAAASNNRWTQGDRTILAGPDLYWKIAGNTTTLIANALGNASVVQNGVLQNYYGFKVYEIDSLPSTVKGLAVTSDALAVAISVPTPQAGHDLLEVRRLQAPDGTDLPIQYVRYYNRDKRKMVNVFETIYGSTVLNTAGAFNLTVSDINV